MTDFGTIAAAFGGGLVGGGGGVLVASLSAWADARKERIAYDRSRIADARIGLWEWSLNYRQVILGSLTGEFGEHGYEHLHIAGSQFRASAWYPACAGYLTAEDRTFVETFTKPGQREDDVDRVTERLADAIQAWEKDLGLSPRRRAWWSAR